MRCPKCSFISFDDLATCAKCSNDLSALTAAIQGTATEVKVPFFLSSVVQLTEKDEQKFSGSQRLTSDDTDINFDETMTGSGATLYPEDDQTLTGLDESIEMSSDDLTMDFDDMMPIDLEHLDEPIDLEDDTAFDSTAVLSVDSELASSIEDDDIDLDLTGDFSGNLEDFNSTEVLGADSLDDDLDLNLTSDFTDSVLLDQSGDFDDFNLDETSINFDATAQSIRLDEDDTLVDGGGLELDDFDSTLLGDDIPSDIGDDLANFDLDETTINLDATSDLAGLDSEVTLGDGDSLDLDEDLMATLTGEFPAEEGEGEVAGDLGDFDLGSDLSVADDTTLASSNLGDEQMGVLGGDLDLGLDDLAQLDSDSELELPDLDDTIGEGSTLDIEVEGGGFDDEQLGNELLATLGVELDVDVDELAEFNATSVLEAISSEDPELDPELDLSSAGADDTLTGVGTLGLEAVVEAEDDEQLGDELLATMDDELDLDLEELAAGSDAVSGDDTLGDGLLATMDDELQLDLEEPEAGSASGLINPEDTITDGEDLELELEELEAVPFQAEDTIADAKLEIELGELDDLDSESEDDDFGLGKTPPLGLEEIDVSDLISAPDEDEIEFSSAEAEGEDMPELEIIDEDEEDEGPPDLP